MTMKKKALMIETKDTHTHSQEEDYVSNTIATSSGTNHFVGGKTTTRVQCHGITRTTIISRSAKRTIARQEASVNFVLHGGALFLFGFVANPEGLLQMQEVQFRLFQGLSSFGMPLIDHLILAPETHLPWVKMIQAHVRHHDF